MTYFGLKVILIGGGLRYPLETTISDSLASTAITQVSRAMFPYELKPQHHV